MFSRAIALWSAYKWWRCNKCPTICKNAREQEILGLVGYWDVVAWDEFEQQKAET